MWTDRLTSADRDRFWKRTHRIPDGCWLWTGPVNERGYGVATVAGARIKAHRLAVYLTTGRLDEGLDVDHLCNVRRCVRPAHLEQVTHAENVRRAAARRAERKPLEAYNATVDQPVLFLMAVS